MNPSFDEGFVSSKQRKYETWRKISRWLSPGSCFLKCSRVNPWVRLFIKCHLKKLDPTQRLACQSTETKEIILNPSPSICVLNVWLQLVTFCVSSTILIRRRRSQRIQTGQKYQCGTSWVRQTLVSEPQSWGARTVSENRGDSNRNTVDLHCGAAAKLWEGGWTCGGVWGVMWLLSEVSSLMFVLEMVKGLNSFHLFYYWAALKV